MDKSRMESNPYELTLYSDRIITETMDTPEFTENDSLSVFKALKEDLLSADFGYYLRRYVFRKAGFSGDFESVDLKEYIDTLVEAFSRTGIPVSLKPTSTKPRAAIRNWLTQKTVSRETVILLSFALGMTLEEANSFFTTALQESILSPKDPIETICIYCLKNHLGYYHFRRLLMAYQDLPGTGEADYRTDLTETMILREKVVHLHDEKQLFRYLNQLRCINGQTRQSVAARKLFDQLYDEARTLIAGLYNETETEQNRIAVSRRQERLDRSDQLYEEQKQQQIERLSSQVRVWKKENIFPADFENVLLSAIPKDRNGNLISMKGCALNEKFRGKRLNRQHIQEIRDGTGPINRYDIVTMSFFVQSLKNEDEADSEKRYSEFVRGTNQMLISCGFGGLYAANPYEAFLLLCMQTEYPLGTYADVWELSYDQVPEE